MKVILLVFLCSSAVLSYPSIREADYCLATKCLIENNCQCATIRNPYSDTHDDNPPQLIALSVSESIVDIAYDLFFEPLLFNRRNPDGALIGATFYVNHEYTNYQLVQKLWLRGFEIGSHSVTKDPNQWYWRNATVQDLYEEFGGQREIISKYAKIPIEDIVGARSPQLQLEGDISIDAYIQSGITYDNSWPTVSSERLFPYTLDYATTQDCTISPTCPRESHPGFWIQPITNIRGPNNYDCNSLASCNAYGTAEEIADWLMGEVDNIRRRFGAPLVLRLDSYWFETTANSFEGFSLFLDRVLQPDGDVFLVSVQEMIEWMKKPVSAADFRTATYNRTATCQAVTCALRKENNEMRYMESCVSCPVVYPWKGNPNGEPGKKIN